MKVWFIPFVDKRVGGTLNCVITRTPVTLVSFSLYVPENVAERAQTVWERSVRSRNILCGSFTNFLDGIGRERCPRTSTCSKISGVHPVLTRSQFVLKLTRPPRLQTVRRINTVMVAS